MYISNASVQTVWIGVFFMFNIPAHADRKKLARGLMALLLTIIIGVTVVDMQLNSLTQRHEFVQSLNLRRDSREGYSAYLFGNSYAIGAVFPVARIENTGQELVVKAGQAMFRLPAGVEIDTAAAMRWLRIWGGQFVQEAHRTKAAIHAYAAHVHRQAAGYIEHYRYLLQGETGK